MGLPDQSMTISVNKRQVQLFLVILFVFSLWLWWQILLPPVVSRPIVYFLNVGQGDSQLILLPTAGGKPISILIDGGRDRRVIQELDNIFSSSGSKYLDLVIMTHPDADHYGGLIDVLDRYQIGAFISNGKESQNNQFIVLQSLLAKEGAPVISLGAGDKISYLDNQLRVLSPNRPVLRRDNDNDSGLVMLLEANNYKALFTADIGFAVEQWLVKNYDLSADLLKVAHHGSKKSSSGRFVSAVNPRVSVIGVGRNSYGHPHPKAIEILENAGSQIYRTDRDGTVKVVLD